MDNSNVQEDLLRLRKKLNDLKGLGYMTPESAGTYEQTIFLTWQEADRRRQSLLSQAETLKRQAAAAEAQAGAFTAMASILYNIVNGFVEAGQKRLREEQERQAERDAQAQQSVAAVEPQGAEVRPIPLKGRQKRNSGVQPEQQE